MAHRIFLRSLVILLTYLFPISIIIYTTEAIKTKQMLSDYKSVCQQFGKYSTIIIRNDDISALSSLDHEKRIFSIFKKYNIPQVIGVIPYVSENCSTCIGQNFHSIDSAPHIISYFSELRNNDLVEIGQHGYQHCSNYLHDMAYNNLSEFADLSYSEQYKKIYNGKIILESTFNQEVTIFLPPYNHYDKTTVNVLDNLGFLILSGGSGINDSCKLSIINRNASFSEVNEYLASDKSGLPPYFFVMYHSYELKSDKDFQLLDSTLQSTINNPNIRFSTLTEFNNQYYKQIQEIESLNNKFKLQIDKMWSCFFYINHLLNNITDHSFKELEKSLRLHDITILRKISINLLNASFINLLVENLLIILCFTGVILIFVQYQGSYRLKSLIFTSLFILLIKTSEIIFTFMKFGHTNFCLSHIIFLVTTGFCFFIYYRKTILDQ